MPLKKTWRHENIFMPYAGVYNRLVYGLKHRLMFVLDWLWQWPKNQTHFWTNWPLKNQRKINKSNIRKNDKPNGLNEKLLQKYQQLTWTRAFIDIDLWLCRKLKLNGRGVELICCKKTLEASHFFAIKCNMSSGAVRADIRAEIHILFTKIIIVRNCWRRLPCWLAAAADYR